MASTLDVDYARSQFPSLAGGYIFADNAGGSQVSSVLDLNRLLMSYSILGLVIRR